MRGFVRGKRPDRDMTELAENLDIILLTTKLPMFSSCGLLYEKDLAEVRRNERYHASL